MNNREIVMAGAQKLIFFRSLPTPNLVEATVATNGALIVRLPNSLVFSADVQRVLDDSLQTMWFDPASPPGSLPERHVVNACADCDTYAAALAWLEARAGTGNQRIFNHPAEVAKTRRDTVAGLLRTVDGLTVPACVRFEARSLNAFVDTFRRNGFSFPVLVRPAGSQTGRDLLRIDNEREWPRIFTLNWFGKIFYMTQFVDFRSFDGRYIKLRVTNIGAQHFVRHVKIGPAWKLHGASSDSDDPDIEPLVERFSTDETLNRIVGEIRRRIRLDYWGIDLGFNGRYVFFEGNPAMTMAGRLPRRPKAEEQHAGSLPAPQAGTASPRKQKTAEMLIKHVLTPDAWLKGAGAS